MANAKMKPKFKAVTPKLKLFRANDPQMSVFMWGINYTITGLEHVKVPVMLMPDDFKAFSKVKVDNHMFNKDIMPSHYKVKEYCPLVFRNLRERFDIDDHDYMNSLTNKQPVEIDSPGRSGARMFMSHDQKYFIKSLVTEEVEQMHHILKQYHQYIVEVHAQTLLPHYLGMYRITVNDVEHYLIIMRNVFSPRLTIHKKYDLKGSTVDRHASDKEKSKDLPTYKDNDFIRDEAVIFLGKDTKDKLMATVTKDAEFLTSLHLMDYSLIVGIHDCDKAEMESAEMVQRAKEGEDDSNEENENGYDDDQNGMGGVPTPPDSPQLIQAPFNGDIDSTIERFAMKCSEDCPRREVYFLAMIDILTKYGVKKRTAQAAKTMKHGANAEISTVKPEQYARRFLDFVSKCIE
ncbi:phosphatidylinositol 5-phosphate 4-kinase type-2 alpha-like [Mytilus californianus]|uniref:phosphatidylinositol 5-phosphate 4-kinase type-2 alpha-like n=1 Tax=Mytilus californianus TaxID=6549 RepID=UPI0022482C12|nr:phosphatidylinositol 5-phosphate 4-kinase type-2 alpha-like [Mytilus californianus]